MADYIVTRAGMDACNQGARLVEKMNDLLSRMSSEDAAVALGAYVVALTSGLQIGFKNEPPQQVAERERLAAEAAAAE